MPNENNAAATNLIGNCNLPKEGVAVKDPEKISGTKRSSSEVNTSQASSAVNPNGNLVNVRRKTDGEVAKISASGFFSNNTDLQLFVNAPESNDIVHPSSTPCDSQVNADNASRLLELFPNSPAWSMRLPNESPYTRPLRSSTVLPSLEENSLHPNPVGKGNTMSAPKNKFQISNPVGISGKTLSLLEKKSAQPHLPGLSSNSASSAEKKSLQHQPLEISGNVLSSTRNFFPVPYPFRNSDVIKASVEIGSSLPRPAGNSRVMSASVESRSQIPHRLGKSDTTMPSTENSLIPPSSVTAKLDVAKESNKQLQQQHFQPRVSLRGLDRSEHEAYIQMLRSLPSAELNRLAFELDSRSIQLSLEEATEMSRLEKLNVMEKSVKPAHPPEK